MNNIDILEEFIKRVKKEQEKYKDNLILQEIEKHCFYGDVPLQAIENLISENKELKEEKQELQKYMKECLIPKSTINLCYIPKSKVEELIEELEDYIQHSANPLSIDNSKIAIKVLQSLLEKE